MSELAAGLRLAIYSRVSTEEQREGQTIDSQISELERFSREKTWVVAGIYKDEGWSGAIMERPELDRLRDDAEKRLFEAVLINDVDRLARDVSHLGVIKRDLERKGIKVIFRKLPSDTSPTHNLMVNILGSFAEFERELIADRVRRGRKHKVEVRQQYLGSNSAYGYGYTRMDKGSGKEGMLHLIPEEAQVVQQMFEWVDQDGLSSRAVMHRLNQLKMRPRKGAASWGKSSVQRILHCETYAGIWHYNKLQGCEPLNPVTRNRYRKHIKSSRRQRPRSEWIPLTLPDHLRIVPHDRWERVQAQIARNVTFSPRNSKHNYLLQGLLWCGGCDARCTGDPCHGKFYYRCVNRCKRLRTIREFQLDDAVKEAVIKLLVRPEVILEPLSRLDEAASRESNQLQNSIANVQQQERRLLAEEQRVLDAYRSGILTASQLAQQLERIDIQRAAIDLKKAEAKHAKKIPGSKVVDAVKDYCQEAVANSASFSHEQWRNFLRTIVGRVIYRGDNVLIEGRIPLRIEGENTVSEFLLDSIKL